MYKAFIWSNSTFSVVGGKSIGFDVKSPVWVKYRIVGCVVNSSNGMLAGYFCCDGECILCGRCSRIKGVRVGLHFIFRTLVWESAYLFFPYVL